MALALLNSRVGNYELVSRHDADLAFPEAPTRAAGEADDAWAARLADYAQALERFVRELEVARETGDYAAVTKPGAQLTRFVCRTLPGEAWQAFKRVGQGLNTIECAALLVRMSLVDAVNWIHGFTVGRLVEHVGPDGKPTGLGKVASVEVVRAFYARASGDDADDILLDLGEQIVQHRRRHPGN